MSTPTLEALKASIAHWERMRNDRHGCNDVPDGDECPLCALFNAGPTCEGCPVWKKTRQHQCDGTPYYEARRAFDGQDEKAWKKAATREIRFLKSLLPKSKTGKRRDSQR